MKTKFSLYAVVTVLVMFLMSLVQLAFAQKIAKKDYKTEERPVTDFTRIEVSGPFEVIMVQDGTEKLSIEADPEDLADIITDVRGGKLVIRYDRNNWGNWSDRNSRRFYVKLSVKNLEAISTSASAVLRNTGMLKTDRLSLGASSGSDLELNLEAGEVNCETSSGADVKLAGTANFFEVDVSSGADVAAGDLKAVRCLANASSGADATVHATEELDAQASSGGDVRYYGNPAKLKVRSSSGGDVTSKGKQ